MRIERRLLRFIRNRHDDAAFLHHAVGPLERVTAYRVEDNIDVLGDIFEFRLCIVDRHISAHLLEKILVRGRARCDHLRAARLCNLDRKMPHAARATVNQHGLSGAQFRFIDQRLPRGRAGRTDCRSLRQSSLSLV